MMRIGDLSQCVLLLAGSHDTHDGLLADTYVVEEWSSCWAGVATRATLDAVGDVVMLGTLPIFVDRVTHEEGGVESHRADRYALTAAYAVVHLGTCRLLGGEDK